MGFLRKNKPKTDVVPPQKLAPVIEKFQSWVPNDLNSEVTGRKFDSKTLKSEIANLITEASKNDDVQLLQFVGKACAGFTDQIRAETVENLAQWVYDIAAVSLELQKKYRDKPDELASIKALGLLAHDQVQNLSNYRKVLDFLGENAKKLDQLQA